MTTSDTHRTIDAVWRIESARIIARLARMVRDVGLAEELAQDTLAAAARQWRPWSEHPAERFIPSKILPSRTDTFSSPRRGIAVTRRRPEAVFAGRGGSGSRPGRRLVGAKL